MKLTREQEQEMEKSIDMIDAHAMNIKDILYPLIEAMKKEGKTVFEDEDLQQLETIYDEINQVHVATCSTSERIFE